MEASGDIVCGEIGCADGERWSALVELSPDERRALESLESGGIVETRATAAGEAQIAGIDQVGVVALSARRRLHIRPKIGDVAVLDWLAYLGECPPPAPPTAEDNLAPFGSFTAAIARQYRSQLAVLTPRLRAGFCNAIHASPSLRGRILPGALARAYHRLPAVPQSRRVRILDTPHHRLLAAALDRLPLLLPPSEPLAWLQRQWADIPRGRLDPAQTVAACAAHPAPGYAACLRLATLILLGAAAAHHPHPHGARDAGVLICLSGVWERALRKMCSEIRTSCGWRPVPDAARTKRWDDGPGLRDPVRWMTADVILTSSTRRWVLDAKYKRGYGDEERNDRFQMTAYAMAFHAGRATLVYPTATTPRPRWRLLLAGQIAGQATTIDSIELPMSLGPAACQQALHDAIISLGAALVQLREKRGILLDA